MIFGPSEGWNGRRGRRKKGRGSCRTTAQVVRNQATEWVAVTPKRNRLDGEDWESLEKGALQVICPMRVLSELAYRAMTVYAERV